MVFHAESLTLKRRKKQRGNEANIKKAVILYREELKLDKKGRRGLRKVAEDMGVKTLTLRDRVNGKQSMADFNATKQKLTPAEENVLVELMNQSSDWSCPFTFEEIARHATRIIKERGGVLDEILGTHWVSRFIERHFDKLKTYWSKPLDTQRAQCLNPTAVADWFRILKEELVNKNVAVENIYGMDESGFPPSNQGTSRVVGRRGNKIQHKQGSANRENVTGIITICADGTHISPLIVFKGVHLMKSWIDPERNPANARCVSKMQKLNVELKLLHKLRNLTKWMDRPRDRTSLDEEDLCTGNSHKGYGSNPSAYYGWP